MASSIDFGSFRIVIREGTLTEIQYHSGEQVIVDWSATQSNTLSQQTANVKLFANDIIDPNISGFDTLKIYGVGSGGQEEAIFSGFITRRNLPSSGNINYIELEADGYSSILARYIARKLVYNSDLPADRRDGGDEVVTVSSGLATVTNLPLFEVYSVFCQDDVREIPWTTFEEDSGAILVGTSHNTHDVEVAYSKFKSKYEAITISSIISDIMITYASNVNVVTYVPTINTSVDYIIREGATLAAIITDVLSLVGNYDWYVDDAKNLHIILRSDTSTLELNEKDFIDFTFDDDFLEFANAIQVTGEEGFRSKIEQLTSDSKFDIKGSPSDGDDVSDLAVGFTSIAEKISGFAVKALRQSDEDKMSVAVQYNGEPSIINRDGDFVAADIHSSSSSDVRAAVARIKDYSINLLFGTLGTDAGAGTGNPRHDSSEPYSSRNGSILFDGRRSVGSNANKACFFSLNHNSVLDFGTNDFTIEFWFKYISGGQIGLAGKGLGGTNAGWTLFTNNIFDGADNSNQRLEFAVKSASSAISPKISSGSWHHIAIVTNVGTSEVDFYIDGTKTTVSYTFGGTVNNTEPLEIGGSNIGGPSGMDGNMAEFRISSGRRYTAGFTPQTIDYGQDSNTAILFHLDDATKLLSLSSDTTAYIKPSDAANNINRAKGIFSFTQITGNVPIVSVTRDFDNDTPANSTWLDISSNQILLFTGAEADKEKVGIRIKYTNYASKTEGYMDSLLLNVSYEDETITLNKPSNIKIEFSENAVNATDLLTFDTTSGKFTRNITYSDPVRCIVNGKYWLVFSDDNNKTYSYFSIRYDDAVSNKKLAYSSDNGKTWTTNGKSVAVKIFFAKDPVIVIKKDQNSIDLYGDIKWRELVVNQSSVDTLLQFAAAELDRVKDGVQKATATIIGSTLYSVGDVVSLNYPSKNISGKELTLVSITNGRGEDDKWLTELQFGEQLLGFKNIVVR